MQGGLCWFWRQQGSLFRRLFSSADPQPGRWFLKLQALENFHAIRGYWFLFVEGCDGVQGEEAAMLYLLLLQGKGPVVGAGEDPAPHLGVWTVIKMVKEMVHALDLDAQFLSQFPAGRLLVALPGHHHAPSGNIPIPRKDIFYCCSFLDEKLALTIAHQHV